MAISPIRLLVLATLLLAPAGAARALADGGPSPGTIVGGDGIRAPTAAERYVALPSSRGTVVAAVATDGGRILRWRTLSGAYGVPMVAYDGTADGLSRDGRRLVLQDQRADRTRFAVLSVTLVRKPQLISLPGQWSFDALSPDARTLFLIRHQQVRSGWRYTVRAYDLHAGRLLPGVIADRIEGETTMRGSPMTRTVSAGGRWVFTLYRDDPAHPFIHGLDTVGRSAICLDLPWRRPGRPLDQARLALTADGRTLELRRDDGGRVASVDLHSYRVRAARTLRDTV